VAKDNDERDRRNFIPLKCNLSRDTKGLAYRVAAAQYNPEMPIIEWQPGDIEMDADTALAGGVKVGEDRLIEATEWLTQMLSDGPVAEKAIETRARKDGVSWRTVRRAKKELKVICQCEGFHGQWSWSLPVDPQLANEQPNGQHCDTTVGQTKRQPLANTGNTGNKPPTVVQHTHSWPKVAVRVGQLCDSQLAKESELGHLSDDDEPPTVDYDGPPTDDEVMAHVAAEEEALERWQP
jgi:hypothetical protein